MVEAMNTKQIAIPPEGPMIEYFVVADEFNILYEVFDKLFEQVEKELRR